MKPWLLGLLFAVTARAAPAPLAAEYALTVSDAARLKTFFNDNAWAKELQSSNLYRGLMLRLAPALFALDEKKDPTWSGRLVDFIVDKLLSKKRITLAYFNAPGLASPFGTLLQDLGATEQSVAKLLLDRLRPTGQASVEFDKVVVQPLQHKYQKFAAVLAGGCLTVSRDPKVAAALSQSCGKVAKFDGARLFVDLKEFYPAWFAVLNKLFGVGGRASLEFTWDAAGARFVPSLATVNLSPNHLVGEGKWPAKLLSALPAETQFFATAFLPDPGPLSTAGMTKYFTEPPKTTTPLLLAHLGMRNDSGKARPLTVVLIPQKQTGNKLFQDVEELFNQKGYYEVRYRRVCDEYLALSPTEDALTLIEQSCEGKRASLKQSPPGFAKALSEDGLSAGVYLNPGAVLAGSLDYGWTRAETTAPAPELADAKMLVGKLSPILFAGKADKKNLTMKGALP